MYSEQDLNIIAKDMAKRFWGKTLNIPIKINKKKTGLAMGTFIFLKYSKKPVRIDISGRLTQHYSKEMVLDTLMHELTHWHIFTEGKNFRDGEDDFEKELKKLGAHPTKTTKRAGELYQCACSRCHKNVGAQQHSKIIVKKWTKPGSKYTSKCCKASIYIKNTTVVADRNTFSENVMKEVEIADKLLAVKEPLGRVSTKVIQDKDVAKTNIVIPGKRGVTNAQMIPAIEKAIVANSKADLLELKLTYPDVFESSRKYIKKSLQFRFIQLLEE